MNFLAHLYLAGNSEPIIIGNFIGDFVKGRLVRQYPPAILQGISLHRSIDSFTDKHPVVQESKKRLRHRYRHYSGVLVDIFYDHFLAKNWENFTSDTLELFTTKAYNLLHKNILIFPEKAQFMLPHMIRDNWLLHYRNIEGIDMALKGMARRTKFSSGMETGTEDLLNFYVEFEDEFKEFFPELIEYVNRELSRQVEDLTYQRGFPNTGL